MVQPVLISLHYMYCSLNQSKRITSNYEEKEKWLQTSTSFSLLPWASQFCFCALAKKSCFLVQIGTGVCILFEKYKKVFRAKLQNLILWRFVSPETMQNIRNNFHRLYKIWILVQISQEPYAGKCNFFCSFWPFSTI